MIGSYLELSHISIILRSLTYLPMWKVRFVRTFCLLRVVCKWLGDTGPQLLAHRQYVVSKILLWFLDELQNCILQERENRLCYWLQFAHLVCCPGSPEGGEWTWSAGLHCLWSRIKHLQEDEQAISKYYQYKKQCLTRIWELASLKVFWNRYGNMWCSNFHMLSMTPFHFSFFHRQAVAHFW